MVHNLSDFCACAFMNQIYIVGGENEYVEHLDTCLKFDTKHKQWEEVARMNETRCGASCTVYEGKIVVSGGWNHNDLNTVEAYHHEAIKWSSLPNLIERRYFHSSVTIRNRLFIIGGYTENGSESCEVFNSNINNFVLLKQCPGTLTYNLRNLANTFSIGSKLVTIGRISSTAIFYDVEKDEWFEEAFDLTKSNFGFSSTLIPQINF